MKKLLIILLLLSAKNYAQEIPIAELETIDGESVSSKIFTHQSDKPIVIAFWATWCIPCLTELSTVNEQIDVWKEKYQFNLYAISTDDDRTAKKVPTLVAGKGWSFSVLLDSNQDLKRKLNINSIPYLIVVKNGKIIYKKTGFVKGDELKIENVIAENQ
jgi:cytochrome c biogenesis protein CcmG, thiol:disulfide interchange protein DsbE